MAIDDKTQQENVQRRPDLIKYGIGAIVGATVALCATLMIQHSIKMHKCLENEVRSGNYVNAIKLDEYHSGARRIEDMLSSGNPKSVEFAMQSLSTNKPLEYIIKNEENDTIYGLVSKEFERFKKTLRIEDYNLTFKLASLLNSTNLIKLTKKLEDYVVNTEMTKPELKRIFNDISDRKIPLLGKYSGEGFDIEVYNMLISCAKRIDEREYHDRCVLKLVSLDENRYKDYAGNFHYFEPFYVKDLHKLSKVDPSISAVVISGEGGRIFFANAKDNKAFFIKPCGDLGYILPHLMDNQGITSRRLFFSNLELELLDMDGVKYSQIMEVPAAEPLTEFDKYSLIEVNDWNNRKK